MRKKQPAVITALIVLSAIQATADCAKIHEEKTVINTYPFSEPDPIPIMMRSGMWGGGSRIYPYFFFNKFTTSAVDKTWKIVHLENPYIEVLVLPEVGGKVYGAVERSTNKEFIYLNRVLKFREVALRGPWTSGGIEFNFGVVGHTPGGATAVDYMLRKNPDGSVSCIVGTIDLPSRTRWAVEITVADDKAFFETKALYHNPTPLHQSYYCWSNAANKVSSDLEFIMPGRFHIGHNFDAEPIPWPVDDKGRNISWYKNNKFGASKSFFTFGEYENFCGGYYHDEKFGFGHWALYDDIPGKKVWLWALSREGGIWEDLLTDADGQYCEPQTGRFYNQNDHEFLAPYTADSWSEIWFPYKEIGPMTKATPYAVLNVSKNENSLAVNICPLQNLDDDLVVTSDGNLLYNEHLQLKPMQIYKKRLGLNADEGVFEIKLNNKLYYTSDPQANDLNCPFKFQNYDESTFEGLFLSAERLHKRRYYDQALKKYLACLDQQPLNTTVLTRLAELYCRRAEYEKALSYARKALENKMYDADAKYIYGVISRKLGKVLEAKEAFGWAGRSMKYRSNAYCQMAEINFMENNLDPALEYSGRSLDYNKYNINAHQIRAITCRKQNKPEKARQILKQLLKFDPLNHLARFELYQLEPNQENLNNFKSMIQNELPHENYIEMALYYKKLGLAKEAVQMLKLAPDYPTVYYYLAWLLKDKATEESDKYLQKANSLSPMLVFPFRQETIAVLQWAIEKAPNQWKPKYYLGLIYLGIGEPDKTRQLFDKCEPTDFPTFYLTRGFLYRGINAQKTIADFETALKMDKNDWRIRYHLITLYNDLKMFDKSLDVASRAIESFGDNEVLQIEFARALINNNRFEKALEILKTVRILPFEGASRNHGLFVRCNIDLALESMKKNDLSKAIKYLEQSKEYPENLGTGKPYDPDYSIQKKLIDVCEKAQKENKKFQMTPEIKQLINQTNRKYN